MSPETCTLELGDGTRILAQRGETLEAVVARLYPEHHRTILAAQLDGEIVDLHTRVEKDHRVVFFPFAHPEGRRTYIRSLLFLLSYAVSQTLPGKRLRILHSMSDGLFCEVEGAEHELPEVLERIEGIMRTVVSEDHPIEREVVNWEKAIHIYARQGREDVVRLFRYWRTPAVVVYRLGDFYDHYYGPLCPRTGYITSFSFVVVPPGFVIQFPKGDLGKLPPYVFRPKLFATFREAAQWGKISNIENVGELNEAIARGEGKEIIAIAEALHEKKIAQIADLITQRRGSIRLVLIAGPSSSGKTTFTRRLYTQLRVNGLKPITISLDDYFLSRHELQGTEADYESPEALDLELFEEQLALLVEGKEVEIPRYNFITGMREPKGTVSRLEKDGVILVEGLHALNPRLGQSIPDEGKFKIYVSALTTLNIDDRNRIPTTDCRLIRRIVRDSQFRGSKAEEVFATWPKVRAGEEKYIFPYQEEADIMFNSSLIYEFCVLRQYAEALLRAITPESPHYLEAYRLYSFLNHFMLLNPSFVPSNSILREFIG